MTQPQKNSPKQLFFRCLARLTALILLMSLSIITPVFSWVMGLALSGVGELYGRDWHHDDTPTAFVILGGGLTESSRTKDVIILNNYSYKRTQTLWHAWQKNPLPIITSGVESPWIENTLGYFSVITNTATPTLISDNASMNTCENARFATALIHHETKAGTLPPTHHIYLVSDWYHMARARRQFALAGLATTPLVAPLPTPAAWRDPKSNLNHSRRAFYEAAALLRDIFRPQKDCRDPETVGMDIIKTPRINGVKTF